MSIQGLDGLKKKYPIFEFRNRSYNTSRIISLAGGDSVQVQPGAVCRQASSVFDQLPAFSDFEPIVPSTKDLMDAGLINTKSKKTNGDLEDAPSIGGKPPVGKAVNK